MTLEGHSTNNGQGPVEETQDLEMIKSHPLFRQPRQTASLHAISWIEGSRAQVPLNKKSPRPLNCLLSSKITRNLLHNEQPRLTTHPVHS